MPDGPVEEAPFERVMRMRIALAIGLLAPLAFFVFLVVRFEEAWILAAAGGVVYLYILAQFFVFQNPRRRARTAAEGESGRRAESLARGEDL